MLVCEHHRQPLQCLVGWEGCWARWVPRLATARPSPRTAVPSGRASLHLFRGRNALRNVRGTPCRTWIAPWPADLTLTRRRHGRRNFLPFSYHRELFLRSGYSRSRAAGSKAARRSGPEPRWHIGTRARDCACCRRRSAESRTDWLVWREAAVRLVRIGEAGEGGEELGIRTASVRRSRRCRLMIGVSAVQRTDENTDVSAASISTGHRRSVTSDPSEYRSALGRRTVVAISCSGLR